MTSATAGQVGRTTQMWGLCALTLSKARVWKESLKQDQKQAWSGGQCQMPQGSFYHAQFFFKDSMAPHSVSEPTLVPLLYTAPNPCQGNSRSCKSKTSWTINQFFWRSISFRRKAKKVERHCQRNRLHFLATFPYAYWKNAFKTGYTSCLSPTHMLAYVYVYAHRHRCKQVVGI